MSFTQELSSWLTPQHVEAGPAPEVGKPAPTADQLRVPASDGKPQIITFLRHCGCPFAEKAFKKLRETAAAHPGINCIAVSHSSQESTLAWLRDVGGDNIKSSDGSAPDSAPVRIVVDERRELYALWGLGAASWSHVLSAGGLYAVYKVGREEGIWNRPTSSGTRWQKSGNWAADGEGKLVWGAASERADDVLDFEEAAKAIESK